MYVRLNIINLSTRITRMTWVAWRCSVSQSRCKCETRIMTRRQEDVVRYVVGDPWHDGWGSLESKRHQVRGYVAPSTSTRKIVM